MASDWNLRPYRPGLDASIVEDLWRAALAPGWPALPRAIGRLGAGFVAEAAATGAPIGFVATDPARSVPLLMVAPPWQRRGCGTDLLRAGLASLGPGGRVGAGSPGESYIWPGVPLDCAAGVAFFGQHGWVSEFDTLDLTQDLRGYTPPAGIYERSAGAGVTLAVATEADRPAVLAFETEVFPDWARWFDGESGDILLARDGTGRIVGSLLYSATDPGQYAPMLGPAAGTIGCVGVAPDRNNLGIGSAMVAYASQLLSAAGTRTCHIGWAVRDRFYGRVGYRPWRRYRMFRSP